MWAKPWRVGVWTVAIGCIALGIVILVHSVGGLASYRVLEYVWPVLLIALGLEIVWHRVRLPGERLRFGGWSVILIAIMFFASLGDFGVAQALRALTTGSGFPLLFFGKAPPVFAAPVQGSVRVGSQVREVDLKIANGSVTVSPAADHTLTYQGQVGVYAQTRSEAYGVVKRDWSVVQNGDILDLTLNQPSVKEINWRTPSVTPHLTLIVPANLITHIHTVFGSVKVSGMLASTVDDTVLGSLSARRIRGSVSENSVNGACSASGVTGSLSAKTVNGDIAFRQIGGSVSANSINGTVAGASGVFGAWNVNTVNGSIQVQIRGAANAAVEADTANGSVKGNVPWQSVDSPRHHGESTLGAGANPVTLHTVSGNITVNHTVD